MNQCDGCARGLPIKNGIHKGEGWDAIACTKSRYPKPEDWPTNERINNIGLNGPTGCHYRKMVKQFLDIPTLEQAAKPKVVEVKKVKPKAPKIQQREVKIWCDVKRKYSLKKHNN